MGKNFLMVTGVFLLWLTILSAPTVLAAEGTVSQEGKTIFEQKCAACHTIGEGRRVGPDLAGMTDRRSEAWLLKFIKSPQAVINSGDPTAKSLFEEFKMIMPDQPLTDEEVRVIMSYIKGAGGSPVSSASAQPAETEVEAAPDEIKLGENLFQGKVRFANGGPSCNSCHHVKNDAVIGGGILAKELTTVFSRMGGEGVRAILGGPPFPVMQAAYKGMPFTDGEIRALVVFLQHADREHAYQHPRDYGWGLFGAGAGGVVTLSGFYWVIGRRRKKKSVNQDIYDRQIKSE